MINKWKCKYCGYTNKVLLGVCLNCGKHKQILRNIPMEYNETMGGGEIKMAKKIIVAKMTHEGKEYIGKREAKFYDGDDVMTSDANVGMTLRVQRQIRDALKVKYGLKKVTSGGEAKDLSAVEAV